MRWKDEIQTGNLAWKDESTNGGLRWKDEVESPATFATLQLKERTGTTLPASPGSFLQVENRLNKQPVTNAGFRQVEQESKQISRLPRPKTLDLAIKAGMMNEGFAQSHPTIATGILKAGNLLDPVLGKRPFANEVNSVRNLPERVRTEAQSIMTSIQQPLPSTGKAYLDLPADLLGFGIGAIDNPANAGRSVGGMAMNVGRTAFEASPKAAALIPKLEKAITPLGAKATTGGIKGGLAGAGFGTATGLANDMSAKDTLKNAAFNAAMFGGIEAGLPLVGAGIKSGLRRLKKPTTSLGAGEGKALLMSTKTGLTPGLLSNKSLRVMKRLDISAATTKAGSGLKWADEVAPATIPGKMGKLENGQRVRSLGVSGAKAEFTAPDVKQGLVKEMVPEGRGAYNPVSLYEADAQAKQIVDSNLENAVRFVAESNEPSALHTATGIRLIEKFQNEGNYDRAIDVAETLADRLTRQGQAISAARIMGSLRPDGILVFTQRQINKINNQTKLKVFGLGKDIKLTPEDAANLKKMAENMQNAADENARIEASQEIQQFINALRQPGIGQKLSTTQVIGQLYNAKTQVRNILGNELFYRLDRINKYPATLIDWTLTKMQPGRQRVVTFATAGQGGYWQGFFQGAKAGWKGVNVKGLQTQYDLGHGLTFRSGPGINPAEHVASFFERSLGAAMKGFDYAAYNRAYNQTLGELATLRTINLYGKADKQAVEAFMKNMDTNLMDIADQYGKYITFQDNNVLSKGLSGVKRALNLGQDFGFGDLAVKYPRTPGALIMRGLEYSPAGFLSGAYQIAKPLLTKGTVNQREVILSLSRAITGSLGLTGMGYFLADLGIITGSASKDKDLRALQQQVGEGAYRVNLSALSRLVRSGFNKQAGRPRLGDRLINYDWAQPVAMAISMGANINQNIAENNGAFQNTSSVLASSLEGSLNTVAEQPVLQGLTRMFQGYNLGENVTQTLKGLPASFMPTLGNQIRQKMDNTGRLTYDPSWMKESINIAKLKTPGLAKTLPVAYDTFGRTKETYQNGSNSFFNVFLNPAFLSTYNPTPEAQMVIDIYKNTGETSQVPRVIAKYFNVGGNKIQLTPQEYSQMQKQVGELTQQGFSKVPTDISDQEKIKRMGEVMIDAGREAKIAVLEGRGMPIPESWMNDTGYLIKAINQGDTQRAKTFTMKNSGNNAYSIYEYGQKHGMVDEQGNPDAKLNKALSAVWGAQTTSQSKTAALNFLLDACERGDEKQAIRWAQVAKQSGLPWSEMQTRIRQKAKLTTTGSKTPTMDQLLQGGYKIDPATVQRAQWAMNQ